MSRVLRWLPVRWLLVVAGAIVFSVLLVWLYGLLGNAVWLPVAVAALVYVEIRLTGISEQLHTDLVDELDHLRSDLSTPDYPYPVVCRRCFGFGLLPSNVDVIRCTSVHCPDCAVDRG